MSAQNEPASMLQRIARLERVLAEVCSILVLGVKAMPPENVRSLQSYVDAIKEEQDAHIQA